MIFSLYILQHFLKISSKIHPKCFTLFYRETYAVKYITSICGEFCVFSINLWMLSYPWSSWSWFLADFLSYRGFSYPRSHGSRNQRVTTQTGQFCLLEGWVRLNKRAIHKALGVQGKQISSVIFPLLLNQPNLKIKRWVIQQLTGFCH